MPYLILRTDVRANDQSGRYERTKREVRRASATTDSWDAAMRMARAFSACGSVRSGRQRVTVIRLGDA